MLEANAGQRVLAAALIQHLETTERTLLLAARSPAQSGIAGELAQDLLETHRVYALAATRAGRPELAEFLQALEPVLLRLANSDALGDPSDVRMVIVANDLPFKVRVVVASTRRDLLQSSPNEL